MADKEIVAVPATIMCMLRLDVATLLLQCKEGNL